MKEILKDITIKLGSRKLLVFLVSCWLLVGKHVDQEIWLAVAISYMGANIASYLMEGYSARTKKAKAVLESVVTNDEKK